MEITWLGHASFKIRGKGTTLVADPFSPKMTGLKFPKVEADVVTISHDHEDHNQAALVGGDPFVIDAPGEYEVKGVSVLGVSCFHDSSGGSQRGRNVLYLLEMEGLRICHLGDLGHKLTGEQLSEIGGVDIVLVPVGGFYSLGPAEAVEVVAQLEPKIIIPMHYQIPGLKPTVFSKLAGVEEFLKKSAEPVIRQPKLVVTTQTLPEERQIVILEPKNA